MGALNSKCCKGKSAAVPILTEAFNPGWAEAVNDGILNGVKFLHLDDPDIIESPINNSGDKAVHIAVRNKYHNILQYLLEQNCDINCKSIKTGNTPLHEAALISDVQSIRLLIKYGANTQIKNRQNKLPKDLAKHPAKREFSSMKVEKLQHMLDYESKRLQKIDSTNEILIGGMSLTDARKEHKKLKLDVIKAEGVEIETDSERIKSRNYRFNQNSSLKQMTSKFGAIIGIDLDDIAEYLKRVENTNRLWNKFVGITKKSITKDRDLFKLLFGLTFAAMKARNPSAKQPSKQCVKLITGKMKSVLAKRSSNEKKKDSFKLTRNEFGNGFHLHLYTVYDMLLLEGTVAVKMRRN